MIENPDIQPFIYISPPDNRFKSMMSRLSSTSTKRKLVFTLLALVLILAGWVVYISHRPTSNTKTVIETSHKQASPTEPSRPVASFAECKTASGSTLTQTTPQICKTKDGQTFTDGATPVKPPTSTSTTPKLSTIPKKATVPSTSVVKPGTSGGGTSEGTQLACVNTIYQTSWPEEPYAGWQDPSSGVIVGANVMTGSTGTNGLHLNICSTTNWNAVANFANDGGAINAYPATQYDITTDKTIGQYTSMMTCFGSRPPVPSGPQWPSTGGSEWDYAYDVWINHTTGEYTWNNDIEIMVWNDWTDYIYPPAVGNVTNGGSRAVTIDGVAYHMFKGGASNEWIYTRDVKTSSGCFDMLNIMKDLVANHSAAAGITLASAPQHIEYGIEIASTYGTQTFQITNASLVLK
jgi:hypothetical protein